MIKIRGHRVLVKLEKLEEVDPTYARMRKSGFAIPESEDKQRAEVALDRAVVAAVGEDAFKAFYLNSNGSLDGFKPWCEVGDVVAFAKYAGKQIDDPETHEKYVVLNDEDIVAVLGG